MPVGKKGLRSHQQQMTFPLPAWILTEVSSSFINYPTIEDTRLFSPWSLIAVITDWVT